MAVKVRPLTAVRTQCQGCGRISMFEYCDGCCPPARGVGDVEDSRRGDRRHNGERMGGVSTRLGANGVDR